jgi:ABC-type oligopeptide transport system ATPase subunit
MQLGKGGRAVNPLLEVKNLKKYFKTGGGMLHAVDNVSFTLDEGKTLGVVGESGCGKSTLGRTVLHLLEPTAGQIFFQGKEITNPSRKELRQLRENMQIIFRTPSPLWIEKDRQRGHHGAADRPGRHVNGGYAGQDRELMDTVGLAARLEPLPHELDGGRRQRIGIACALALEPKFIVARARVRPGRVHSGPGHQPDDGPAGAARPVLHVRHPRPVVVKYISMTSWSCIWARWWKRPCR